MGKVAAPKEVTRDEILKVLRRENPAAKLDKVTIYADAMVEYLAAQANIAQHGSIVFHPRTGAPIENPYLKVRNAASKLLVSLGLRSGDLWVGL